MKKILFAFIFLASFTGFAEAQTSRNPCFTTGATTTQGILNCVGVGVSTPLPVILGGGSGGAAGSTSNASSGVATSSTNIPAVAYNYVWNGATWDQASGLTTGTVGVPSAQVVTVQPPATNGTYPTAAVPIQGNGSGSTGAVVGTLAGTSGKTTYICDFDVTALGTAASIGPITVAGLLGGSKVYQMGTLATGVQQMLNKNFSPCIPASAANTAITITTTADGTATAVNVNSSGYQQ
jgi:hypothetical protein